MVARHSEKRSFSRPATLTALIVVTVGLSAMAFGPVWLMRVAVWISILLAVSSVIIAWRQIDKITAAHYIELKAIMAANRQQAEQSYRESVEMIDQFEARSTQLANQLEKVSTALGAAHCELATMRGNAAWLRGEIAERQVRIDQLNARLSVVEDQQDGAEVVALLNCDRSSRHNLVPTAEELWADGNHPTVIDITKIALPWESERRKQA